MEPIQGISYALIERSLRTLHSKIWVFGETNVFAETPENGLNPPRWVEHHAINGRKAPLPDFPKIDLEGSFIDPLTDDYFVDELKIGRPFDLYFRGLA